MGKAYDEAERRTVAYLNQFMYYNRLGFEIVCSGSIMMARHKKTGCIIQKSTPRSSGNGFVPHLLCNSLNAVCRKPDEYFIARSLRNKLKKKLRRK